MADELRGIRSVIVEICRFEGQRGVSRSGRTLASRQLVSSSLQFTTCAYAPPERSSHPRHGRIGREPLPDSPMTPVSVPRRLRDGRSPLRWFALRCNNSASRPSRSPGWVGSCRRARERVARDGPEAVRRWSSRTVAVAESGPRMGFPTRGLSRVPAPVESGVAPHTYRMPRLCNFINAPIADLCRWHPELVTRTVDTKIEKNLNLRAADALPERPLLLDQPAKDASPGPENEDRRPAPSRPGRDHGWFRIECPSRRATSAATASVKLSVDSEPPRSRVRIPWRSRSSVAFLTAWPALISPSW